MNKRQRKKKLKKSIEKLNDAITASFYITQIYVLMHQPELCNFPIGSTIPENTFKEDEK